MGSGCVGKLSAEAFRNRKHRNSILGHLSVVVFGATGMIGGAVARALIHSHQFTVTVVTRNPTNFLLRRMEREGVIIGTADLDDPKSLERVVQGADAMFLVTHYWQHLSKRNEKQQGMNAVYAAVRCKVKHLVFLGSESVYSVLGKKCGPLDAKYAIEQYIKGTGIPYTILRVSFFYENFLTVFRPHNIGDDVFAIPLPLEGNGIDCIGVNDMSKCVLHVLKRHHHFVFKTIGLTVERLTAEEMAATFQEYIEDKVFIAPDLKVSDFEKFRFPGSKELTTMFKFYNTGRVNRDEELTRHLVGFPVTFSQWVMDNTPKIHIILLNRYNKYY